MVGITCRYGGGKPQCQSHKATLGVAKHHSLDGRYISKTSPEKFCEIVATKNSRDLHVVNA